MVQCKVNFDATFCEFGEVGMIMLARDEKELQMLCFSYDACKLVMVKDLCFGMMVWFLLRSIILTRYKV